MIRKGTLLLLALALVSAIVATYLILRPGPVNESERYRDNVVILGHERVRADNTKGASAVFVGDELSDVEVKVSVFAPQVKWFTESAYATGDLSLVVEGYGNLDGIRCYVKVSRIRPSAAPAMVGTRQLSAGQMTGLTDGSLEAIKVAVLCDPQDEV
jgi:hypothetical protein